MKIQNKLTCIKLVADCVIEHFGRDNIFYQNGKYYIWNEDKGLWEEYTDTYVFQKIIIEISKHPSINFINSVLNIISLEVRNDDIVFNCQKIINCKNCYLEISENGIQVIKPNKAYYSTIQYPVNYNSNAEVGVILKFFHDIFEFDEDRNEKIQCLLEFIGCTLAIDTSFQKFMMFIGNGANGKSVTLDIIKALLGKRNYCSVDPANFGNNFQLAHLENKVANIVSELDANRRIPESILKQIVSGETRTVEHKGKNPIEINFFCKCFFATNSIPRINDYSKGFQRRPIILNFNKDFTVEQQELNLKDRLLENLEGLFFLSVRAYQELLKRGHLIEVRSSKEELESWIADRDVVKEYFTSEIELHSNYRVKKSELYFHFRSWSTSRFSDSRNPTHVLSKGTFTSRLRNYGVGEYRTSSDRYYEGIRIKGGDNVINEIINPELQTELDKVTDNLFENKLF